MAQTSTITGTFVDPTAPGGHLKVIGETATGDQDHSLTVPTGRAWHVQHLFASLTTSAVAANRRIRVRIFNAAPTELSRVQSVNDQVASTTEVYNFGTGVDVTEAVPGIHNGPLGPLWLGPGFAIRVTVEGGDVGDNLALQATVVEYLTTRDYHGVLSA